MSLTYPALSPPPPLFFFSHTISFPSLFTITPEPKITQTHIISERNREHAKRSRIRKKFLLESLQQSVAMLKEENDKLRDSIRTHVGEDQAKKLLDDKMNDSNGDLRLTTSSQGAANKVLDDPDFSFIKALQTAQQNFVVTDPSLPDNPIVYASQGFLNLTGYSLDQILGRNCRFLQGPETDPKSVERIRNAIEQGEDLSVCLLNYRVDGSTFWNQFFIAALRDASGNITNFVGVQCKVSDTYAASVIKEQQRDEEEVAEDEDQPQDQQQTTAPPLDQQQAPLPQQHQQDLQVPQPQQGGVPGMQMQ
jgi:PAS domain S-box-containing protein